MIDAMARMTEITGAVSPVKSNPRVRYRGRIPGLSNRASPLPPQPLQPGLHVRLRDLAESQRRHRIRPFARQLKAPWTHVLSPQHLREPLDPLLLFEPAELVLMSLYLLIDQR